MSRTAREDAVAELLHRLADHARTEPSSARDPLTDDQRGRRRPTWTMGVAAALLIAALASASLVLRDDSAHRVSTAGEVPALPGGTTERLAAAGLRERSHASSVWTGEELLVWGGSTETGSKQSEWLGDGAALDPVANRWRSLPPAPIGARSSAASVWTGTEMLVWGGGANGERFLDGAAFNPRTNRWRTIASNPFERAFTPAVVWTGKEMLVFSSANAPPAAAAYDPASDRWRRLPAPPGLLVMPYPQVVWTGSQAVLVLWPDRSTRSGSPFSAGAPPPLAVREPLDPAAGTTLPPPPGPPATGLVPSGGGPNSEMFLASFSPESDQWSRLPAVETKDGSLPRLVWTGREVLLLQTALPSAAFDPKGQTWRPRSPVPHDQSSAFVDLPVWTGRFVLLWAGGETGLAYDPEDDVWRTFDAGGLAGRSSAVVAWADGFLVGWGGSTMNPDRRYVEDGIRYRPPPA